jgi:hypothetical protein
LLSVWTIVTVLPNCWTLAEKEMGRYTRRIRRCSAWEPNGEKWYGSLKGSEATENKILAEVPGMIGDMEPRAERGFIGLSRSTAKRQG